MIVDENFSVPAYMNLPWLTERYVGLNAWLPVARWIPDDKPEFAEHSQWGIVPCKSRTEFRAGDIIVFDEYDDRIENGEYCSGRFYRVPQEHIDELFFGIPLNLKKRTKDELKMIIAKRTCLLPVGVVVHPPSI